MNSNDILDMVGDAKGTYVWDAQNIISGSAPATKKKVSAKRTLLIAAMIAICIFLSKSLVKLSGLSNGGFVSIVTLSM